MLRILGNIINSFRKIRDNYYRIYRLRIINSLSLRKVYQRLEERWGKDTWLIIVVTIAVTGLILAWLIIPAHAMWVEEPTMEAWKKIFGIAVWVFVNLFLFAMVKSLDEL
jgi:hypothetical protein